MSSGNTFFNVSYPLPALAIRPVRLPLDVVVEGFLKWQESAGS
ncbi:hypothetical protein [Advenella mandrilli]|nr:hypothetical protein [Advenella mandrilli]